MTSVSSDPLIGHTLEGRYVIHSRIARGGMATVYMATDNRLHRTVAIKAMHPHLAEDPDFRNRFEQEARNAAKLTHPNLVSVLDQGEEGETVYLVMEYLPGITLRELLKQQRFLTTEQTIEVSESILSGLSAAHAAGIIHRDLKPENVLLADDGRIKLADFGLARPASANTGTGQALLGTIAYLSPELVTRGVADKQSDVYAFGIMMFEMLTGEQPFTGDQPMQIAYQHAHEEVPAPSTLSTQSTPELDAIVLWATDKEPEKRPADAAEMLQAVEASHDGPAPDFATKVLGTQVLTTQLPRTTVVDPLPEEKPEPNTQAPTQDAFEPRSATALAYTKGRKQRRKGAIMLAVVVGLAALAAGAGWYFGSGPGSLVTVPELEGLTAEEATQTLEDMNLTATTSECYALTTEVGGVVDLEPAPGTRVERESSVNLCISIGPESLETPDLTGLNLEEAQKKINEARFIFGKVRAEQFSDQPEGTVLWTSTEDGDELPQMMPEQSVIDVVVSAGKLPEISDLSDAEAREKLSEAGLEVDDELGWLEYSDSVKADRVISAHYPADTMYRGDSVGLVVSRGPELFEVPDISGMKLQEAMDLLSEAGFEPSTLVPEILRGMAEVKETVPAAGEMAPKGSEVQVKSVISL